MIRFPSLSSSELIHMISSAGLAGLVVSSLFVRFMQMISFWSTGSYSGAWVRIPLQSPVDTLAKCAINSFFKNCSVGAWWDTWRRYFGKSWQYFNIEKSSNSKFENSIKRTWRIRNFKKTANRKFCSKLTKILLYFSKNLNICSKVTKIFDFNKQFLQKMLKLRKTLQNIKKSLFTN